MEGSCGECVNCEFQRVAQNNHIRITHSVLSTCMGTTIRQAAEIPLEMFLTSRLTYVADGFEKWISGEEPAPHPNMAKYDNIYIFRGLEKINIAFQTDEVTGEKTVVLAHFPTNYIMRAMELPTDCFKRMIYSKPFDDLPIIV